MRELSTPESLLLQLLNDACWERQETELPSDFGQYWSSVWQLATEQGVTALVANELLSHHAELLPMHLVVQMMGHIKSIKTNNEQIELAIQTLQRAWDEMEIPSMIIKGPISANNYPEPYLRSPGDIDLYIWDPVGHAKAMGWIEEYALKEIKEGVSAHERAYLLPNNVKLELHHQLLFLHKKRYNQTFRHLVDQAIKEESLQSFAIGDCEVKTLPTTLNALYLFLHLFSHFLYTGIGLRQIYDWLLFLQHHKGQIETTMHNNIAEEIKLLKAMQAFGSMAVTYLGATPDIFPFEITGNDTMSSAIIEDIFKGGNFGLHDEAHTTWDSKWKRNYRLTRSIITRSLRFGSIAPHYYIGAALHKIRDGLNL